MGNHTLSTELLGEKCCLSFPVSTLECCVCSRELTSKPLSVCLSLSPLWQLPLLLAVSLSLSFHWQQQPSFLLLSLLAAFAAVSLHFFQVHVWQWLSSSLMVAVAAPSLIMNLALLSKWVVWFVSCGEDLISRVLRDSYG